MIGIYRPNYLYERQVIDYTMTLTSEKLATYTNELKFQDLTDEAIDRTERIVYDTIGCALGAYTSPPSKALRECYSDYDGSATVFGSGDRTATEYSAFINSAMARYLDYNDTYVSEGRAIHPSDHIPALMAVAESEGSTGEELIEAIVLAYEIEAGGRDTGALNGTGFDYVVWGTLSCSAAVGKLMGLTHNELISAIGIAGTSSNGLVISRSGDISMWKGCAHGYVNHNAVQACQMARAGMTGPEALFEGRGGFFETVTGEEFDIPFGGKENETFRVEQTNIKPYPCGYYIGSAVEAGLTLLEENNIDIDTIESITVESFQNAAQALTGPEKRTIGMTRETADHSIAYTVAVSLVDGQLTPRQYQADKLNSKEVFEIVDKITVEENPELTQHTKEYSDSIPHIVEIHTPDGTYSERIDYPVGHWKRPMSDQQLEEKVGDMALKLLSQAQFDNLTEQCKNIRDIPNMEPIINELTI